MHWIALPLYRILFFAQLRVRKTVASTRGLIFLLFTSRYTLHILLSAFALPIAFTQLRPASANADVGQHSILYALVTNGKSSVTQETFASSIPSSSSYLDETVTARANIDYDYDPENNDPTTDHGMAGTVALRPQPSHLQVEAPEPEPAEEPVVIAATPIVPEVQREVINYTIMSGDTIARIARQNGVSQNTILWANNLTATSKLRLGDTLKIPPVSGVLHTVKKGETLASIAKKYSVDLEDLKEKNLSSRTLAVGSVLVVPDAKPVQTQTVAVAPKPSSASTAKPVTTTAKTPKVTTAKNVRPDVPIARIKNKAFDIYQELASTDEDTREAPVDEVISETKSATKLLWPTARHAINQYYGWSHTGIDIDGDYTDPIYASADGSVTEAGWNSGGYGLQVVIAHDGGLKTRYGHASKLFVKVGEEVKRGEVIGYVGTTGRSTGTHLHYEVYKNGKRKNPLTYIK